MPRFTGPPKVRGDTSRGVHVRALWWVLSDLIDVAPSNKRARLRTQRALLERAYPAELGGDTDIAQYLAELDGDEVQDGDV